MLGSKKLVGTGVTLRTELLIHEFNAILEGEQRV